MKFAWLSLAVLIWTSINGTVCCRREIGTTYVLQLLLVPYEENATSDKWLFRRNRCPFVGLFVPGDSLVCRTPLNLDGGARPGPPQCGDVIPRLERAVLGPDVAAFQTNIPNVEVCTMTASSIRCHRSISMSVASKMASSTSLLRPTNTNGAREWSSEASTRFRSMDLFCTF